MVGWVGVRVAMLWPQTGSLPKAIKRMVPLVRAEQPVIVAALLPLTEIRPPRRARAIRKVGAVLAPVSKPVANPARGQVTLLRYGLPEFPAVPIVSLPKAAQPIVMAPGPGRWSASAWMVARPGTGLGAAPGVGQLGGSQMGLRIAYILIPENRVGAFARLSAPLQGRGAEGAVGVEWQPLHAPVRLVAEQRFGLDGAGGGTGLGAIAGLDMPVLADFRLEAYGQAGAILRDRIEPYADGAARATRVVAEGGSMRLSLGAGAWGAAQREAGRLDLGPSATLGLGNIRLALDWRQRVAGDARPGSGPALTIGGDF